MQNTDKTICRMVAQLLAEHAVSNIVVSPGSRNAPLLIAMARQPGLSLTTIIDERSAAFIALGMAVASGRPVALACTSGTALLNYAPAIAEAYYRQVPLVVISADRPMYLIDQDDSQTIRQAGVLDKIVAASYDIDAEDCSDKGLWYARRTINEAIIKATSPIGVPVHINLHLSQPLGRQLQVSDAGFRPITSLTSDGLLSTETARSYGRNLVSPTKVMIVVGGMLPDAKLNRALSRLAAKPNIAVLCQPGSNMHSRDFIYNADCTLGLATDQDKSRMVPDIVIAIGGPIISGRLKKLLRSNKVAQLWHVGMQPYLIDTYMQLTMDVKLMPAKFLSQMASAVQPYTAASDYAALWHQQSAQAYSAVKTKEIPWSDLRAMSILMDLIPDEWNLHLSNGTSVRYAALFDYGRLHRVDCNRGVSGIDGCTSTAIGAATVYSGVTLLITGDMSAQYDMGALAAPCVPARFKMIVLNNRGGGIFRGIPSTSCAEECETLFCGDVRLPLAHLSRGFGFDYHEARDAESLVEAFKAFASQTEVPAILNIVTPPDVSAREFKEI